MQIIDLFWNRLIRNPYNLHGQIWNKINACTFLMINNILCESSKKGLAQEDEILNIYEGNCCNSSAEFVFT